MLRTWLQRLFQPKHSFTVLRRRQARSAYLLCLETLEDRLAPANVWTVTGNLGTARAADTATPLNNGQVLVAGGYINGSPYLTSSAELYNPTTNIWTSTGSLNTARYGDTATLLNNGEVLVAGGSGTSSVLSSAELYDPTAGTWAYTGSLNAARAGDTATLLNNGKVLVVGGGNGGIVSSAELYDPTTGTWSTTGSLNTARSGDTATLLNNGKVLVAGGYDSNDNPLSSAELYDPTAGTWAYTGSLNTARSGDTATLLNNGEVLVAGGFNTSVLSSVELYDPTAGTWTAAPSLITARSEAFATLLNNGQVLVTGGSGAASYLSSSELYDPTAHTWSSSANLNTGRAFDATLTLLKNGQVLIAGGSAFNGGEMADSELYSTTPTIGSFFTATFTYGAFSSATVETVTDLPRPAATTFSAGGLPSWASINSTTGVLSGTPTATTATPISVTITASNGVAPDATITILLAVNPAPLFVTAEPELKVYGQANPTPTASYGGLVNGDTPASLSGILSFATSASASSGVGIYTIVPSGLSSANYSVTYVSGTLTVTPAPLAVSADTKFNFYGQAIPALTATYSGFVNGDTSSNLTGALTLGTTAVTGSGAGTYPITVSGVSSSNYGINFLSGTLFILPAPLTVKADDQIKVAGQANPTFSASYTGLVNGDTPASLAGTLAFSTTAATNSAAGVYAITPSGVSSSNYNITFLSGTLFVMAPVLSVNHPPTANADSYSVNAGGMLIVSNANGVLANDTDADGDTLSAALLVGPSHGTLTLNSAGGFVYAVAAGFGGSDTFIYKVFDGQGGSDFGAVTITVNAADSATTAANVTTSYSGAGQAVALSALVTSSVGTVNGGEVTFTVLNGNTVIGSPVTSGVVTSGQASVAFVLPGGTAIGSYTVQAAYSGTRGYVPSSDSSHDLIVSAGAPAVINITSGSGQSATVGTGYNAFSVQVTDAFGNPVSVPVTFSAPATGASGAFAASSTTTPSLVTFPAASMSTARDEATATLLGNGDVLVAGGKDNSGNYLASAELYNPATNAWTSAGAMATGRSYATATLLGNGNVLVAGGDGVNGFALASAELYNPVTNSWSAAPDMAAGREDATATLLGNGDVLVVAGYNSSTNSYLADAQLYDPVANSWSSAGALTAGRESATATLLGNGDVLVAGGANGNGSLADAELYNPATNSWSSTPDMLTASRFATATLLGNGNVLVAGGQLLPGGGATASAELYNPVTNTWSAAASLATARAYGAAALLGNGDVLVAGGFAIAGELASAELYDPVANTWTSVGAMAAAREGPAATLLGNGTLLVAGGYNSASGRLSSAELLTLGTSTVTATSDPATGIATAASFTANETAGSFTIRASAGLLSASFQLTNTPGTASKLAFVHSPTQAVAGQTLSTFKVDVEDAYGNVVSSDNSMIDVTPSYYLPYTHADSSAQAVNGVATFNSLVLQSTGPSGTNYLNAADSSLNLTLTSPIPVQVTPATPTLVSIAAGSQQSATVGTAYSTQFSALVTDAYGNPVSVPVTFSAPVTGASGAFGVPSLAKALDRATATLLGNGDVLIAGGEGSNNVALSSAELYNPVTNGWSAAGSLATARYSATATLLANGEVLVAGGQGNSGTLSSAELYNPVTNSWSVTGSLAMARYEATATLLGNGEVLVAAGYNSASGVLASAELYNPATNTWSAAGSLATAQYEGTATLLNNGEVLIAGGYNGGALPSAELYNPATNSWTVTGSLNTARYDATATLLGNGDVLVAGGYNSTSGVLSSAELYNPVTNTWSAAGALATARYEATATLLGNGDVQVAGGQGSGVLSSVELYNPLTNTWSAAGSLATARFSPTATLLGNGDVLVVGGDNFSGVLSSAERINQVASITTVTATTDPVTGIATAPSFTANDIAGSFTITASVHISATLSFSTSFQATDVAGAPVSLTARSVTTESATVATAYAPLRVLVADAFGNPVSNSSVTFTVAPAGNGSAATFAGNAASVSVATGGNGQAVAPTLTAGHTAGAFMVTASLAGIASPIDFFLTNTAGAAASITVAGGGVQGTPIGFTFGSRLEALVADAYGNPVANAAVTSSASTSAPSATFSALTTVLTTSLGIATAPSAKADFDEGTYAVIATTAGVATHAIFNLTNTDVPAAISGIAGNNQTAKVTQAYAVVLQARVTNAHGVAVSGIPVVFTLSGGAASGTFTGPATAITNAFGVAGVGLTANTVAGAFSVSASVIGVTTSGGFNLLNVAGAPTTIASVPGTPTSATVAKAYATPLQALVTDAFGNPVSGVSVTFTAPGSGASGTFATKLTSTAVTAANGVATAAALTANTVPGNFAVTASISGVATPATYNLTNLPGPAAKVTVNAGSAQTATVAQAFANPLKVLVTDAFNNPLSGVSVTFTAPTFTAGSPASVPSGVFTGSSVVLTNASGIATAPTLTANNKAGNFSVSATVTGLSAVSFALSNAAGAPAKLTASAGTPQHVLNGSNFSTALQALVTDQFGNKLSGVTVTFTVQPNSTNGAAGTFPTPPTSTATAVTSSQGVATAPVLRANNKPGVFTVVATVSNSGTNTVFTLTND